MRRRQALAINPPAPVQTELEPINTSRLPDVAPRRRLVLAEQFGTAVDISQRAIEQLMRPGGQIAPPQARPPKKRRTKPATTTQAP